MLTVAAGRAFLASVTDAPTGLVGTIGVQVVQGSTVMVARTTSGVTETPSGSGTYEVTLTAPTTPGAYLLLWDTGGVSPTFTAEDLTISPAWYPSVDQVAAILRARTRGASSRDAATAGEQGTFTTTTRPTAAQVTELIAVASAEMAAIMGGRTPCTIDLVSATQTSVAYRAAMLVEISYFPEQTNSDQTAFGALEKMWEASSRAVSTSVEALCPLPVITPGPDGEDGGPLAPAGTVPGRVLIGPQQVKW